LAILGWFPWLTLRLAASANPNSQSILALALRQHLVCVIVRAMNAPAFFWRDSVCAPA
jgi:hypothetical protein